jgi:hypothetical protein
MLLTNSVLTALQCKDSIGEQRSVKCVKLSVPVGNAPAQTLGPSPDAVVRLLRNCPRLEQLEMACADANNLELEPIVDPDLSSFRDEVTVTLPPLLYLPNLKSLCLSTVPIGSLFVTLLRTPLPSLRHLVVAPHRDQHTAQLSALLATNGCSLTSLRINTPRHLSTSTGDMPAPPLLTACPELHYLALDQQLLPVLRLLEPAQDVGSGSDGGVGSGSPRAHPLRVLTIPRPNARFFCEVESLLPHLPSLSVVRARAMPVYPSRSLTYCICTRILCRTEIKTVSSPNDPHNTQANCDQRKNKGKPKTPRQQNRVATNKKRTSGVPEGLEAAAAAASREEQPDKSTNRKAEIEPHAPGAPLPGAPPPGAWIAYPFHGPYRNDCSYSTAASFLVMITLR